MEKESDAARGPTLPTLGEVFRPVWGHRTKVLLISLLVAAVTLVINFLLPVYYKSTATILPETEKNKLASLGQFAGIASLAGVNVSGSEIARLYPTIVLSETVLRAAIERKYWTDRFADSVDLVKFFDFDQETPEKNIAASLKKLRSLFATSYDNKTSIVTLTLAMREPQLAADVLNAIIQELDGFMRSKRLTSASEQVRWIDVRLKQVQTELRGAEEALKSFRDRNRRIADSPDLLMQQGRLMREVETRGAIVVELKKQFELAKLDEIKNITIVNVLDAARPPVKRDTPQRVTNTAVMFLIALIGLSAYYAAGPIYGNRLREFWKKLTSG